MGRLDRLDLFHNFSREKKSSVLEGNIDKITLLLTIKGFLGSKDCETDTAEADVRSGYFSPHFTPGLQALPLEPEKTGFEQAGNPHEKTSLDPQSVAEGLHPKKRNAVPGHPPGDRPLGLKYPLIGFNSQFYLDVPKNRQKCSFQQWMGQGSHILLDVLDPGGVDALVKSRIDGEQGLRADMGIQVGEKGRGLHRLHGKLTESQPAGKTEKKGFDSSPRKGFLFLLNSK